MQRYQQNGVAFYRFAGLEAAPAVQHAVFTRRGGVSRPPFAELNLGHTVGDDLPAVQENHRRVYGVLDASPSTAVTAWLVHGRTVAVVDQDHAGQVVRHVDALITQTADLLLLLRFADCLPLLLYDPVQLAVGLVHAGWRGTVQGVAVATVQAMQQAFGSRPADLWAGIGPGIGPCCYEVGDDVVDAVRAAFPHPQRFLPRVGHAWHFDLPAANAAQLEALGVRHIELTGLCTGCQTEEFFSHRAERGRTGRFGVAIRLQVPGPPSNPPCAGGS